jgi:hypothetical protein
MKKYLLAVLALGATMMMACEPANNDNNGGNGNTPEPEVVADYNLTDEVVEVILENYGDYYGAGINDYNLTVGALTEDGNIKMLFVEYMTELSNKTGEGVFGPAGINWETGEGLAANTYIDAAEIEGEIAGSGYIEMNMATEEYTVYDGIVSGDLTVKKEGENYVIKGLFTTLKGKTLKVDYTGAATFDDYSNVGGGAEPLSVKKQFNYTKHFSSAAKFFKK